MKRFLIYYKTPFGRAEFWVNTTSKEDARRIFRVNFLNGELDEETDGTILSVEEQD